MNHTMDWISWGGSMMFFWWILLAVGIVFLIKWIVQQTSNTTKEKSALDILKERYARGEISKEEFEQKRKEIA